MAQPSRKPVQDKDAIDLLEEDHQAVDKLFKQFQKMSDDEDDGRKQDCVARICRALTVHATIEEEIFYPAVREEIEEDDMMDEAEVEHDGIKRLLAELKEMAPGEDLYDAKVTVLGEYVKHHVHEEESQMFPKVKGSEVDTAALGAELARRKEELETAEK